MSSPVRYTPLLAAFLCTACTFFSTPEQQGNAIPCETLILLYMAGDNSLNRALEDDIAEIEGAIFNAETIILAFADRHAETVEDDWNEARIYEFTWAGGAQRRELDCPALGLYADWLDDTIDSGSSETLRGFLHFASERYQAQRRHLVLWNHGGGWKSGEAYRGTPARNICSDQSAGGTSISLPQVRWALQDSAIGHFDIVLLDACTMGTVEVAAAFAGLTDILVASQNVIPEGGMPYTDVIPLLSSQNSGEQMASALCSAYYDTYRTTMPSATLSAIKIDIDDTIHSLYKELGRLLDRLDIPAVTRNRSGAMEFTEGMVDISVLSQTDASFHAFLDDCILYNASQVSSGISIYFPEYFDYAADSWEYATERQPFLAACPAYRIFLQKYAATGIPNADRHEPNNTLPDATLVHSGEPIQAKIWCPQDIDMYLLPSGADIHSIVMRQPSGCDYDLTVYLMRNGAAVASVAAVLVAADTKAVQPFATPEYDTAYIVVTSPLGFFSQEEDYCVSFQ